MSRQGFEQLKAREIKKGITWGTTVELCWSHVKVLNQIKIKHLMIEVVVIQSDMGFALRRTLKSTDCIKIAKIAMKNIKK